MDTENKIKDAETEPIKAERQTSFKSFYLAKKKNISTEMIMILLVGILFGIAVKTEIAKRINVADKAFYGKQSFDFAQMQKNLDEKQKAQNSNSGAPQGGGSNGQ